MIISQYRSPSKDQLQPALRIFSSPGRDSFRLVLSGEFDLAAVPDFCEAVAAVGDHDSRSLVVDLTHVAFCDSSGFNALTLAARKCDEDGTMMRVTGVRQPVRAVFEIMHAHEVFPVEYSDGSNAAG